MYFLSWVIVGSIIGWSTGKLLTSSGYGPIMDIPSGIAGGIAGGLIMHAASLPADAGLLYTSMAAMLGAAFLTWLIGFVYGKKRYA
jgi:uncharacterized membrane protein YeaQ/YmgE (transglycosylase-associated protein family)